jgi:hypothetical protein
MVKFNFYVWFIVAKLDDMKFINYKDIKKRI